MAWMMHLITRFPEVQVSLQKEADSVLGEAVTLDHFQDHERLRYLEAVANETMRLKPVAPMLFLETKEAVELGGIDIPAGTALFLLTRQIAMQERAFTAAAEFRPQRWLAAPDTASRHDPAAFLPFGGGPRFCPGRYLAMLEVKAVMAMLCRNFSIAATGGAVDERFAFTMMPANLSIQFTAR
jgi:cytochrome P450